ncbi:MAG: hypothetical protein HKP38_10690 [Croceitalea sp.]|nr:hypothetical protein [Croceitalea sp.]NNL09679.1 hypothetical protein [Croceitalea sp.]
MKKISNCFIGLCLLLASCSSDDVVVPDEIAVLPSFMAIGEDELNVFQINYDGQTKMAATNDLSAELGINSNYLTLRQVDQQLTFYTFSAGAFNLAQKDIVSGAIQRFDRFYVNTDERSIVWGANSLDSVFFGFYAPLGSTNLALRVIDINNQLGEDIDLEFNINTLYQPLYANGKLFITYQNNLGEYKIVVYNTVTQSLSTTLNFNDRAPSIFLNNEDNVAILSNASGSAMQLQVFDFDTLEEMDLYELDLNQVFLPGAINMELMADKLYYEFQFSQPSEVISGPAVYDLANNTNTVFDITGIINAVEEELDIALFPIVQDYSPLKDAFLIGFAEINNQNELKGGVIGISAEGQLLGTLETPFVPTYFVKD